GSDRTSSSAPACASVAAPSSVRIPSSSTTCLTTRSRSVRLRGCSNARRARRDTRARGRVLLPADRRRRRAAAGQARPLPPEPRHRADRRDRAGPVRRPVDAGGRDAECRRGAVDGCSSRAGAGAGRRDRAERWLEIPPRWSRWWIDGVVELGREMTDVDIIYAWMSPYESAVAATRLSAKLGRPWVADLGDPWALDEMTVFPSALHRQLELRRMRRLLGSAAAIVMSTPEAVRRVREAFPELAGKPILAIPNGFDAGGFEAPDVPRSDDAF